MTRERYTFTRKPDGRATTLPGEWRYFGHNAILVCPVCSRLALLDHEIDRQGNVHPSVACPDCDFHEFVLLDGWKPR